MNAYLGFLRPTKSYKKRKQMIDKHVNPKFWEYVSLDEAYTKAKLKK
ncbi:MAG: hypothetical protein LBP53_04160 [Candidatus Peribacteria bacterium]|jgi:hypothetical protein|nr:hypothetical protein [Candidatus Peribacteria bacterium]